METWGSTETHGSRKEDGRRGLHCEEEGGRED
jgi:hypothetical protein